jgi:signal transduction histidine kinase/DNA-binding NarL/FixJ family response regulator/HPt (histidine-containing phosphotransfer) domain-containing protein
MVLYVASEDRELFVRHLTQCRTGKEVTTELRLVGKGGGVTPVQLHSVPLDTPEGHKGCRTSITDVSALQAARRAAEAADAAKSVFLARMSHELRTPLNAVMGMMELALSEELSPTARDCLETAKDGADLLLQVLNEILDLSRVEAGKLRLECAPFGFRSLLEKTLKPLGRVASQKGLEFVCTIAPEVPDQFLGDALRLRQIVSNLVSNAVKFTETGRVAMWVTALEKTANDALLEFTVSDTGIGIAPEAQKQIFSPFSQADVSMARRFGGTGLGLSITRSLATAMGGQIRVESSLGVGSTFYVTIRLSVASESSPVAKALPGARAKGKMPAAAAVRPLRVLLAEDMSVGQKLIRMILEKRGHRLDMAHNGRQALELARQHDFDVVLMDVQMPVMDGYQATAAIRALSESAKARVPIVALTAHALEADQKQCLAAGMNSYLSKPVDARKLIEAVERWGEKTLERETTDDSFKPRAATPSANMAAWLTAVDSPPTTDAAKTTSAAAFDFEQAMKKCFGEQDLLQEVVGCFHVEAGPLMERMRAALGEGKSAEIAAAVHRLKNTLIYLAAEPALEASRQVERASQSGDLAAAATAIENLDRQLDFLKDALDALVSSAAGVSTAAKNAAISVPEIRG